MNKKIYILISLTAIIIFILLIKNNISLKEQNQQLLDQLTEDDSLLLKSIESVRNANKSILQEFRSVAPDVDAYYKKTGKPNIFRVLDSSYNETTGFDSSLFYQDSSKYTAYLTEDDKENVRSRIRRELFFRKRIQQFSSNWCIAPLKWDNHFIMYKPYSEKRIIAGDTITYELQLWTDAYIPRDMWRIIGCSDRNLKALDSNRFLYQIITSKHIKPEEEKSTYQKVFSFYLKNTITGDSDTAFAVIRFDIHKK